MSSLSDGELYQEVGKIVANFDILECYECAQAVIEFLQINDIKYKILRLKTRYSDEDFVVSDRLMSQGINDSIK
ncbi:MAG: papain fold toxin domain-containing protein [Nostoc sp. CreGUA01]